MSASDDKQTDATPEAAGPGEPVTGTAAVPSCAARLGRCGPRARCRRGRWHGGRARRRGRDRHRGGERFRRALPWGAPGRCRHRRAGPAALRGLRCEDEGPRRAGAVAEGLDAGRGADDRRTGRRRGRVRRPAGGAAGRHRRGTGPQAVPADADHRLRPRVVRQGPLRARRPAAQGPGRAAEVLRRQPRPGAQRGRSVRAGLRRRSPGRGARHPQPRPDRLRQGRGALVAAGLRQDVVHDPGRADAPQPLRVQGRHPQHRGDGRRGADEACVGVGERRTRHGWPAAPTSSPAGSG